MPFIEPELIHATTSAAMSVATDIVSALTATSAALEHVTTTIPEVIDPTKGHLIDITESEHFLFIEAALMLTLILIGLNINRFLHAQNFHYLSESAVFILLGFVAAIAWTAISYDEGNKTIQLNASFFYLVLLPPIIFEVKFFFLIEH
jgi:hypothetical protein